MPGDQSIARVSDCFLLNFEKSCLCMSTLESRAGKGNEKGGKKARSHVRDRLTQLAPIFHENKFMLGTFSMLDLQCRFSGVWITDIDLSERCTAVEGMPNVSFLGLPISEALTLRPKVMRK
jgi:RNA polymerase-associated protein